MIHFILEWRQAEHAKLKENEEGNQDANEGDEPFTGNLMKINSEHLEECEEVETNDNEENHDFVGCVKVIDNVHFDFEASHVVNPLLGLVLTPTRELAVQVKHHIDAVTKFTGRQCYLQDFIMLCSLVMLL